MKRALRLLFWLVVGLSLLANAVLLGLWFRLAPLREALFGRQDSFRSLPADLRRNYRAALAASADDLREKLAVLGAARSAMFRAAAADPPDRAALEAALVQVRAASTDLQVAAQAVLLDALDRSGR